MEKYECENCGLIFKIHVEKNSEKAISPEVEFCPACAQPTLTEIFS